MLINVNVVAHNLHTRFLQSDGYEKLTLQFKGMLENHFGRMHTLAGREIRQMDCKVADFTFMIDGSVAELEEILQRKIEMFMVRNVGSQIKISFTDNFGDVLAENDRQFRLVLTYGNKRLSCFPLNAVGKFDFGKGKAQMFFSVMKNKFEMPNRRNIPNALGANIGVYDVTYNSKGLITEITQISDSTQIAKENFFDIIFSNVETYTDEEV